MTIFQNDYTAGRKGITTQAQAGVLIHQTFSYNLRTNYVAPADIIEIAGLPQGAQLAYVEGIAVGITAGTDFSVGFMTGRWRDPNPARTMGTQIFAAAPMNTRRRLEFEAASLIPPVDAMRSIGVALSANEAGGTGKWIHLSMGYYL